MGTKSSVVIVSKKNGKASKNGKPVKLAKLKDQPGEVAEANGKETKVKVVKVDAWGSRVGSQLYHVNELIRRKGPVKMSTIMERLHELHEEGVIKNYDGVTRYNHVNRMIDKKFVVKTDDGYVAADSQPKVKKTKKS